MRYLAEDRSIIIKLAAKGSFIVAWNCQDYPTERKKQLSDITTYEDVTFSKYDISDLVDRNNNLFLRLKRKKLITEKEYKYLIYKYKKVLNWVNSILLQK